ncbi:MAG: hypothetical protein ACKOXB_07695 [Flavobacteriales bacterium]
MKNLLFLLPFLIIQSAWSQNTQNNLDDDDYEAPYHMFHAGGGASYNAMINKYGINTKFNVNFTRKIAFGPEFTYYFPNSKSTSPDFFYELNLTGSLVELSKVSFFGLTGITYQQARPAIGSPYATYFQGINLGFGMQWRKDHLSMFTIAKVTSSNSNLWLTAGACYYFDIDAIRRLNNKYNLNKRTRKD